MRISVTEVAHPLPVEASDDVRAELAALGRTEDLSFSPSGGRLALVCYASASVAVLDVERGNGAVAVTSIERIAPPSLREPHGVEFVDEETLVVADRAAGVHVLDANGRATRSEGPLLDSPGSVVVRPLDAARHEVLACNNWSDTLARLVLQGGAIGAPEIVGCNRLDLPDGLALSSDAEWLAVSNHNTHTVLVFAYRSLSEDAEPVGVLRGVLYPHGLRFVEGDRALLVADAGAPYVHVFTTDGGWHGARYPSSACRVMDEATFAAGHRTPQEGGPKGLDVEERAGVVAVTSEHQPLALFDLDSVVRGDRPPGYDEALTRYELHVHSAADALAADTAAARALTAEVLSTRAWRLTAPVRSANAALRRLARR